MINSDWLCGFAFGGGTFAVLFTLFTIWRMVQDYFNPQKDNDAANTPLWALDAKVPSCKDVYINARIEDKS